MTKHRKPKPVASKPMLPAPLTDSSGVPTVPKPISLLHPFQLTQPLEEALAKIAFTPLQLPKQAFKQGGRHTDLTNEIATRICIALRYGAPRAAAAEFAQVRYDTLKSWLTKKSEPYETLRRYVDEAEQFAQMYMLNAIFRGVWADPKYAFEYLSRRWPDRYGPAPPDGTGGGTTNVNIAVLLEEITQRKIQDPRRLVTARPLPPPNEG